MKVMNLFFTYTVVLMFFGLHLALGDNIKNDPRYKPSNAFVDNLNVEGVPKKFMDIILRYAEESSNDVIYRGHEIDRDKKTAEIIRHLNSEFPEKSEGYFLQIVKTSKNSLLRSYAFTMFYKTKSNNGLMLNYARQSLSERDWENGTHLDLDIGDQMRVLVAYGEKSDLALCENIWNRMDDQEKNSFKVYRKMLTKALKSKDSLTRIRAARGDRKAQNKLLDEKQEEENSSVFSQNKQFIVGGIALIVLIIIYVLLKRNNKIAGYRKN